MATSLKGKNLLPEGKNLFLYEQFLMVWKITFTTLSHLPWMLSFFLLRTCVTCVMGATPRVASQTGQMCQLVCAFVLACIKSSFSHDKGQNTYNTVSYTMYTYEPWHEISNNVVCATSKASDLPAHTRSLIRAFSSRLNNLWVLNYSLNIIWCF